MTAPAALARYETNQDVSRRRRAMVARQRAALIAQLGGRCVLCGAEEDLSFEHPFGRTWTMHRYSQHGRLHIIKQEITQGLIQLLCMPCNRAQGGARRYGRRRSSLTS